MYYRFTSEELIRNEILNLPKIRPRAGSKAGQMYIGFLADGRDYEKKE